MKQENKNVKTEITATIDRIQETYYIQYGDKLSKIRVRFVIEELLKDIQDKLIKGEEYTIYKFGKFYLRHYPARVINNTLAENVQVEDHNIPAFTPAPELNKLVRYPTKQVN